MVHVGIWQRIKLAARVFVQRDTAYNAFTAFNNFANYKNPRTKMDIKHIRRLAKTPIARSAITQIKDGVTSLPWRFKSIDGKNHDAEIKKLTNILNHPNQTDDFVSWLGQELDDMLVADMGCSEIKTVTSNVQPLYLFPIDCDTLEVVEGWDGDPAKPRYAQYVNGVHKFFTTDKIFVMSKNNFTHSYFGLSPTETAYKHIQYLINCQDYADSLASDAMPKYLVNIGKDAGQGELDKLRNYIQTEVQGQSTLAILATDNLESKQVSPIGDDAMSLSWQKMLLQIIATCYNIPPEKLGSAISNDRSTVGEKEEDFIENTIKPWARVVERAINKYVVARLGMSGFITFEFMYLPNQSQKESLKGIVLDCLKNDTINFNEARRCLDGVLPIVLDEWTDGNQRMSEYKNELNIKLALVSGAASQLGDSKANHEGGDTNG